MLNQEWKAKREMMMEIETLETEQSHHHLDDPILLEGMLRMTFWASTDWKEVESIEHRNMDIIIRTGQLWIQHGTGSEVHNQWTDRV